MDAGRQPVTFENPLYATAPAVSGDPAVIHATQVLCSSTGGDGTISFASYKTTKEISAHVDMTKSFVVKIMFWGKKELGSLQFFFSNR